MMRKPKLLSVTYEESLLRTREWILEKAGYDVTSALGFVEAQSFCTKSRNFDLVIIGHTVPIRDKAALIDLVKQGCGATVLCLRKANEPAPPQADFTTDRADPDGLVEAIRTALRQRKQSAGV